MRIIHRSRKEKFFFIVNTTAGRGKTGRKVTGLIKKLNEHNLNFEIEITKAPKHAITLARDAIKHGYRKIVAAGGDGTVNEVLNGIMLSHRSESVMFGIIPKGGGNDFAHYFHIPHTLEKALEVLTREKTTYVDVGKIEDYYFGNALGIGFDAKVAENSKKIRYLNGMPRYFTAVLMTLIRNKSYKMKVKISDEEIDSEFLMLTVGNCRFSGSGFQLTPDAKADDGIFDLCLIDKINRRRILKVLPTVIPGKHLKEPEVTIKRSSFIEISSEQKLPVYFDGEIPDLKDSQHLKIELLPKKINLIY